MLETTRVENASTDDSPIRKIGELRRLRLHNLVLQQQLCREQLNGLIFQFLQTEQPKALQSKLDDLSRKIEALARELLTEANLDPQRCDRDEDKVLIEFIEGIRRDYKGWPSLGRIEIRERKRHEDDVAAQIAEFLL